MKRLLLWDVDGTLIDSGDTGRVAYLRALSGVLGYEITSSEISFSGKTDPQIARELLEENGVEENQVAELHPRLVSAIGHEMAGLENHMRINGCVLPGVVDVLSSLGESDHLSTLLTGNLAVNAVLKMNVFRLSGFIDIEVGAFGSDRENRTELLDVCLDRLAKRRDAYFVEEDIWVIGDTPFDYGVAQKFGTRCLLVATGTYGFEELSELGADCTMHDLSDTRSVLQTLES